MDFERDDLFLEFTKTRRSFEDFLMTHRTFPNQVAQKFGSGIKGFDRLKQIYAGIFENLKAGKNSDETFDALRQDDRFGVLAAAVVEEEKRARRNFDSDSKSAVF
jgi:hypothetical protein